MENNEQSLRLEVTIQEFISDSVHPLLIAFQIKTNHETIKTSSYEILKGQNLINETLTFAFQDRFPDSNQEKLELLILIDKEVAGSLYCNITSLINSKLDIQYENDSYIEIEENAILNSHQMLNPKVKLRLKVLNQTEEFSQRTTINLGSSDNKNDQNQVISEMRVELDHWKSKYNNLSQELDSLGDELLSLSIKEKAKQFSYLSTQINIFRKIMKSKLQHFLQIYDNQIDQIYLLKKELNSFRSKICCKCSEPLLRHSCKSLNEKILNLTSIIDKKSTENIQLMKSLEVEKQQQKSLQNKIIILNQQQLQLRQALAKSRKQVDNILKLQTQQEQENEQLHKDIISKTQVVLELNIKCLELEKQISKINNDYTEIITLYKQWSLSIYKSFEKESFEKQQLIDAFAQLNNQLQFFTIKENQTSDSNQFSECQCKIEQYIQDYRLQIEQLEQLLNQYRKQFLKQNQITHTNKEDELNKFMQIPVEYLREQGIKLEDMSNYQYPQIDLNAQNLIQQKEDEITKLKQKIGDMLNIALELGNSMLIEQIQLTIM